MAVVTGGNRGIWFEVCRQLVGHGYDVVLGSRDAAKGEEAAAELGIEACQLDVADERSVREAAAGSRVASAAATRSSTMRRSCMTPGPAPPAPT